VAAYQVELTARARKQYKALDPVIRDRVRRTFLDLADDPTPAQVKALAGGGGLLRVRVARGGSFTAWSATRPAS
jgi:mRNA-degrading endonuclease RelE of RelBE toxin-antitoxin system